MKVIKKAAMKNGTEIQLEDWREHNTEKHPNLYGFTIGAYPIAKRTGKWRWVEGGKRFRLDIPHSSYMGYTNEQVESDYNALINGTKTLEDLSDHFWNGKKDMFYLGMDVLNDNY